MEGGVHGPVGPLVASHVDSLPEGGCDFAIILNLPTMAHTVQVMITRSSFAVP